MEHVRRAFEGDDASAAGNDTHPGRPAGFGKALHDARHILRAALWSKFDADADEQKRIAEILRRAAAEIVGKRG
jgi:hypothetical protein